MSSDVTKRAVSAGLGVGALALLARRASADTPFSSFAFPSTGAPTARTLPDRLAEIKNVRDFGAKGDGVTDDAAAIQAAVNAVFGETGKPGTFNTNDNAYSGVVFFPPGTFIVKTPIQVLPANAEFNIHLLGVGLASRIFGQTPSGRYIFERLNLPGGGGTGLCSVEKLWMRGNCLYINHIQQFAVRDCRFQGNGIRSDWEVYPQIEIRNCEFSSAGDPTSVGVLTSAADIFESNFQGLGWGVKSSGIGGAAASCSLYGCRFEMNFTGVEFGGAINIHGCGFEGNGVAMHLSPLVCTISGVAVQPQDFAPGGGSREGLIIDNADTAVIMSSVFGGQDPHPGINILNNSGRLTFISTVAIGSKNQSSWSIPATPDPTAHPPYVFINCNNP
jgi:hypothetical protein